MTLTRREDKMLLGFVDIVGAMVTLPVSAERKYETKKSRSYKTSLQSRKKLLSPMTTTRDVDPFTDLGIGLVGTMIRGL